MAAPTTEVAVANLALKHLGVFTVITSLTENAGGTEQRACGAFYELARNDVLKAHDWKFARRESAALTTAASQTRKDWAYAYALPADYLHGRRLWSGARVDRADQRIPFEVLPSGDALSQILFSDVPSTSAGPILIYTYKHGTVTLWPSPFVAAVSWAVAAAIAYPLTKKADIAQRAASMAQLSLQRAIAYELTNGREDPEPVSEFISVRG